MKNSSLPPFSTDIKMASEILKHGGLVAFPTETVYGLGADATQNRACARIFEVKQRPSFNPLIAHGSTLESLQEFAYFDARALSLAKAFWPGPLTLILNQKKPTLLSPLVTAGLETVAVRVPAHPMARALIEAVGRPLAAPSANVSGKLSPTEAWHVSKSLGNNVDLILDGGISQRGLESTIIDLSGPQAYILRQGSLSTLEIEGVLGIPLKIISEMSPVRAPGQLLRHYAPRIPLRLNASNVRDGEALLAFGDPIPHTPTTLVMNLSPSRDLREAASNLFTFLHRLEDTPDVTGIAVQPIPETGLGHAIIDRLMRGAHSV